VSFNLQFKKKSVNNSKALMNEGPTVIGMMSVVIGGGGSLDTAIRDVVRGGPCHAQKLFRAITFDADTRVIPDIKTGVISLLASLPESLSAFRRSMYMVMAASESSDKNERARMLKDASDISLLGLREAGEAYSSSLNTPCMAVFGLGIMVPMVLMSILPMLSIGGMFGSSPVSSDMISAITLFGIPAVIVMVILSVRDRNPFMSSVSENLEFKYLVPFMIAVPIMLILVINTGRMDISIVVSFSVAGLIMFLLTYPDAKREKIRLKQEIYLKDSVFELGNNLISGNDFENALVSAINVRKECAPLVESVKREMMMCRGDNYAAIRTSVGRTSLFVSDLFCDICRCAQKDLRDAGRLAISVGRQLQDQETVRKSISNKLKSMVDMMTGTAMLFAPLVLGMSISMLKPLSDIVESSNFGDTTVILLAYLIELCVLMSFLTAYLNGNPSSKEILRRIGMILPISLIVFYACTMITF
jgi:hypothetical protein